MYRVWQCDRDVSVVFEDAPGVDDRDADHLAVLVVADAMALGCERSVGGVSGVSAEQVEDVAVGVGVAVVEDEIVDLDVSWCPSLGRATVLVAECGHDPYGDRL